MKILTILKKQWLIRLAAWGLVSVASSALAQGVPVSDPYNQSRSSSFTYDPVTGLLISETIEPDNPNYCVTTTYQYDAYGNKKSATTSNCAGASGTAVFTSRASTSTYSAQTVGVAVSGNNVAVTIPQGMFPTSIANALSQSETKVFDPRFGAVTSLTGPNALTTNWQVDDLGRKIKEIRADGTSTVTAYCYLAGKGVDTSTNSANCPTPSAGEAPSDAISFVHTEPHNTSDAKNGPFSRVYLDRAGHKIRTVTEAFDGAAQPGGTSRLIVQDTDYSDLGAPLVTTQPYFLDSGSSTATGANDYGMSKTVYDALGRAKFVYISDAQGSQGGITFSSRGSRQAAMTKIAYDGLTVVTTNDKVQTHTEEKNVDGKVIRVTDALGAQVVHQHDAFGNLIATKDALQNTIVINYDLRGRKVAMTDPDTGNWQYDYDALGEMVWQQSPNQRAAGTVTTLAYDVLGRMTKRTEPEYVSNWIYDSCTKGVGKLCSTSTSHGVSRTITYDNLGRPFNTRTDMSGTVGASNSFASAVAYDSANGRVFSQTYPTGLTVNYNYTAKGFLQNMALATAATINPLPATAGGTPGASTTLAAGSLLWQAQAYNAWGSAERQSYGNGVVTQTGFDAMTGRVAATTAGIGGTASVMNYSYQWDSLNHLVGRTDANGDGTTGAVTDSYAYDDIGRLQNYTVSAPQIPNLQRTVALQYNALGMTLYKSDVGAYTYGAQATDGVQPHALQSVAGTVNANYTYDANGNLKTADSGSYRNISYTSFNLPDSQAGVQGPAGGPQYQWQYDENHQRIKEVRTNGSGVRTTWMLHPDAANGLSFESEQGNGVTSNRHYLTAGGVSIGVLVSTGSLPTLAAGQTAPTVLASITLVKVEYWHKDHLGSLVSTTDHTGAVTARYSYDPFGKRRYTNGTYDTNGNLVIDWTTNTNNGTDRGYAGAEHLDDIGIIHMNGRLFDPTTGRFLQADPFVQDPTNLQNFNRYGYCYNNPMTCTDPTGQVFGWDDLFYAVVAIWTAEKVGVIDARTARGFTGIAVAMVLGPEGEGQLFSGFEGAGVANAAVAGFASGAISSGSLKGGLQGMVSNSLTFGASGWSGLALNAVVGCVSSEVNGGKCGPGAVSASFSYAFGSPESSNPWANLVVKMIVGGTASKLGGGKFANGAETAAFSYLMDSMAKDRDKGGHKLDADFRGEGGAFSTDTPGGLASLRQANPELVEKENLIWTNSFRDQSFMGWIMGYGKEQGLVVYQSRTDGSLQYDLRYKATGDNFTMSLAGLVQNVPAGYDIILIEHTHPATYSLPGGCIFACLARGPSPKDMNTAKDFSNVYFVIQTQPPGDRPVEFEYFGARKR